MNMDALLSQILYSMSGFFFGIFASRYSVLHLRRLKSQPSIKHSVLTALFIVVAFTLFPFWLLSRTEIGAYIYYVTLLLFFAKGMRVFSRKDD